MSVLGDLASVIAVSLSGATFPQAGASQTSSGPMPDSHPPGLRRVSTPLRHQEA
jgi:hypothetical protein